jgi:hypothetical protein
LKLCRFQHFPFSGSWLSMRWSVVHTVARLGHRRCGARAGSERFMRNANFRKSFSWWYKHSMVSSSYSSHWCEMMQLVFNQFQSWVQITFTICHSAVFWSLGFMGMPAGIPRVPWVPRCVPNAKPHTTVVLHLAENFEDQNKGCWRVIPEKPSFKFKCHRNRNTADSSLLLTHQLWDTSCGRYHPIPWGPSCQRADWLSHKKACRQLPPAVSGRPRSGWFIW